jgi:hypothetical protein
VYVHNYVHQDEAGTGRGRDHSHLHSHRAHTGVDGDGIISFMVSTTD